MLGLAILLWIDNGKVFLTVSVLIFPILIDTIHSNCEYDICVLVAASAGFCIILGK